MTHIVVRKLQFCCVAALAFHLDSVACYSSVQRDDNALRIEEGRRWRRRRTHAVAFSPSHRPATRLRDYIDSSAESVYDEEGHTGGVVPTVPSDTNATVRSRRNGTGSIYLVGSGPGDPELLTLAAYRRLQDPSALVVADRLVSPEILELVRGEVRIARKLPGCAEAAQTEIYEWCAEALRSGRDVVRLKIGDPFVFGRGGEEVLYFRSAVGVEPVVIPGVSAALAAPLLGGIPVTHRGVSSQVVTCTGYGRNGTSPDLIRYHPEQTVVFLMAVGRLRELCANLQRQAGYPADTPVAIVERAGCPQQRTLVGDMTDIADLAETHTLKPPCTIVVGGVVKVLLGTTTTTDDGEACSPLPHGLIPRTNERDAAVVPS